MPYYLPQKQHELSELARRIENAVYTPIGELEMAAWRTPEPVPFDQRETGERITPKPDEKWGSLWDCAWFHFTGEVPDSADGKPVVLLIDLNGEALVVDEAGNPRLGLTTVSSEFDYSLGKPGKRVVPLLERAKGGEKIDLWADAACNDLFGRLQHDGTVKEASIALLNPEMRGLHYDVEVLAELMRQLPEDSARRSSIWDALCRAALKLERFTAEEARAAREVLAPELARRNGDAPLRISAIGHAHMDLAWLWPLRETVRKGARTFATALHFMEKYPDYHFGASQPQLFQWMKDHYPSLYERIKQRVAEGRLEVQGAMWVEADANVPSGESLVRQLLYGKRFFRQEFGIDVRNLWLPDVFGYSGALPQILKKAGVDYFMTQKLSWSIVNRHPHHTFLWQGIDGSRVLAHLLPEDTYNSSAAPRALAKAEKNYLDKALCDGCLLLFGIGDGGGGPGEEHLERLEREKDLLGLPPVTQERGHKLLERFEAVRDRLPYWAGELYLERHQGTFTTQARNKRGNRKLELALRELELAASQALWAKGQAYPQEELESLWKEMLLYQFHDILPGSSITRVYTESVERYAAMLARVEELTQKAEAALFAEVETSGMTQPVVLRNSLSWDRRELVQVRDRWVDAQVPAMGHAVVDLAALTDTFVPPTASTAGLENDLLKVTLNADGSLAGVWDKQNGREVLASGAAGNCLAVYQDEGDAWDFAMHYDERPPERFVLRSSEARVEGPQAIVEQVYSYGMSTLTQKLVLTAGSRRLDFTTHVDWRESNKMLRTSFPTCVVATEATCEIQFGSLRRPTHRNTSWDFAKFEVCAHKWVDLSDRGYGVALLNDCKYGHKLRGSTLDLDLLRSPGYPDPQADRAEHDFTYSLFPHAGDHVAGGVIQAGYELNAPLRVVEAGSGGASAAPVRASLFSTDAANVILDAVKKAEESEDLILRLYESTGATTRATLRLSLPVASVELVNLMEEDPKPLPLHEGSVVLDFRPFEVHTLKLRKA
ncbi:MAG TPA: glycoside hydrolase family 38 C-terminal domain-containing protein [Armatimonadota bacterium]